MDCGRVHAHHKTWLSSNTLPQLYQAAIKATPKGATAKAHDVCAGNDTYTGSTGTEVVGVVAESTDLTILYTPDPAINLGDTTFYVTLTSGGPGYPGVVGRNVILSFGDGTGNFTSSTNSSGIATFLHDYASDGTFTSIGIFAGAHSTKLHANPTPYAWCLCLPAN